ncbi:uncharacterized protein STEHIDRAFT_115953 [Stereum hirsutum FP-91666 SS1]|uniref:Ribonuclease H1 N-terminal domain-containing protein n=1 Tax=Stereum hirsutum (strain FP-91666) TaxID=721885 RepID=R7RZ04_STEHR|nr:uncharacterized protein STEHIDRAFT_115953 [Stereum hirsutum FP-91666 SS1]EIM80058.1 hypothetical protein STEHIDRAFT_115953 [Stereum hirsutum FP-91666 SS1]
MHVALNIDGLSDALETGLNLSVALRRDAPQTERTGRARAAREVTEEDGYASAGDDTRSYKSNGDASDEYDIPYPEVFNYLGHWVVFDGEDRGYYCDFREVQRVTAGMSDPNIREYKTSQDAQQAYDIAIAAETVAAARAAHNGRRSGAPSNPGRVSSPPSHPSPHRSPQLRKPSTPVRASSARSAQSSSMSPSTHSTPPAPQQAKPASASSPAAPICRSYPDPYIGPGRDQFNRDHGVSRKNKQKCYVVFIGRRPGIYFTWREALAQTNRVHNASHGSYTDLKEAVDEYHARGRLGEVRVETGRL